VIIRADIPWGLPAVCIGPSHLTQTVLNLAGNAVQAIAECARGCNGGGRPENGSRRGEVKIAARLAEHGRAVRLTIADNGTGMSPEILTRAFEPYFTTRGDRGGTGLGLAMIRRLVGDAGGRVRLRSSVGHGTTVFIALPTCDPKQSAGGGQAPHQEPVAVRPRPHA
jgi:signal transduction histidine kinase